jgi:hypothetical protein
MITEIAKGLEPSMDIAFRYGYDSDWFDVVRETDWFDRLVESQRAELRTVGWTAKREFSEMATVLMQEAYHLASASDNVSLKLDVAKYAAKLADMEPKSNAPASLVGTGFSININLSGGKARDQQDNTIIDVPPRSDLPPAPSYLAILPFESLTAA